MNNTVILAVVVLAVLGAVFGLVLAFASKVFAVEKDPREEEIASILPGANCGGCGFPGCSGYAAAVAKGEAPVNACAAGGAAVKDVAYSDRVAVTAAVEAAQSAQFCAALSDHMAGRVAIREGETYLFPFEPGK